MDTRLDRCLTPASGCLFDAMSALDLSAVGIALVVDEYRRLLGTMTDGDVRRALLGGAAIDAPVQEHMQRSFRAVAPSASRAEVLDWMLALKIEQVPVVDAEGKVLALHLLRELVGETERPNWGVIMAGGKGMRLRPLTESVPKPMLPVAGRPILERIVLQMVGHGFRRIFVAVNYLGGMVKDYFGDGWKFGCQIEYLTENQPLDTGGALSLLPEVPSHPILVMNGDLVTQADLGALLDFHDAGDYAITVAARPYVHRVPFGCLELDGKRVVSLVEKPQLMQVVNAGMYAISPDVVAGVPKQQPFSMPWLISNCLNKGQTVGAFEIQDDWIDVGQMEQLKAAREGAG